MTGDEQRKKQLELQLQTILANLAQVCSELDIDLGQAAGAAAPPRAPSRPAARQQPAPAPTPSLMPGQVLLAEIGGLEIGFVSTQVQELTRMVALAPSVDPRPELEGYVNVRGQAVPVVNLRHLLGGGSAQHSPHQFLVFLRARHGGRLAVVVDEVNDIHDVTAEQIQGREALDLKRGFVQGVIQIDGRLIAIIDPQRLTEQAL